MNLLSITQPVVVKLGGVYLYGRVTKVSYTQFDVWYGVRLDTGEDVHGVSAANVSAVQ